MGKGAKNKFARVAERHDQRVQLKSKKKSSRDSKELQFDKTNKAYSAQKGGMSRIRLSDEREQLILRLITLLAKEGGGKDDDMDLEIALSELGLDGEVDDSSSEDDSINDLDCESVFNLIMQSAPTISSNWEQRPFEDFRYFTNSSEGTGSGGNDLCFYYLTQTIKNQTVEPTDRNDGNGFIYDPRIGQVIVFSNN